MKTFEINGKTYSAKSFADVKKIVLELARTESIPEVVKIMKKVPNGMGGMVEVQEASINAKGKVW